MPWQYFSVSSVPAETAAGAKAGDKQSLLLSRRMSALAAQRQETNLPSASPAGVAVVPGLQRPGRVYAPAYAASTADTDAYV